MISLPRTPLLTKIVKQAGGDAVAHRVGDVEADVLLVEAEDVVEVAADVADRPILDRETHLRHLRQGLRQEARLDPARELQLGVDLVIRGLEPFVDARRLGRLRRQAVVPFLDAQQRPKLQGELGRISAAGRRQVRPGFKAAASIAVGQVDDRHEAVAEPGVLLAAQGQHALAVVGLVEQDEIAAAEVEFRRPADGHLPAGAAQPVDQRQEAVGSRRAEDKLGDGGRHGVPLYGDRPGRDKTVGETGSPGMRGAEATRFPGIVDGPVDERNH